MPLPSFSIKMLLDPQIGSHQPITPKFGPHIGGFTNLEEVLLSLGGRPKNVVQIINEDPTILSFQILLTISLLCCVYFFTLCAKTCSWCTNGVLDRLSHDVLTSSSSSTTVLCLRACSCSLLHLHTKHMQQVCITRPCKSNYVVMNWSPNYKFRE